MVGEIRDMRRLTFRFAPAMTGHLVSRTCTRTCGAASPVCSYGCRAVFAGQRGQGVHLRNAACARLSRMKLCGLSGGVSWGLGVTFPPDFKFYRGTGCDHLPANWLQGLVLPSTRSARDRAAAAIDFAKADGSGLKQCAIAQAWNALRHRMAGDGRTGITTIESGPRHPNRRVMAGTTRRGAGGCDGIFSLSQGAGATELFASPNFNRVSPGPRRRQGTSRYGVDHPIVCAI